MVMKKLALLFLSFTIVFAILGCGDDDDTLILDVFDGDNSNESKNLVIWGEVPGTDADDIREAMAYVSDNNPYGITLEYVPVQGLGVRLAAARLAGDLPDLVLWPRPDTATYAPKGFLYELHELVERDGMNTDIFYAEALRELKHDSALYGLPVDIDPWGIWVNMGMVESHNADLTPSDPDYVTVPTTWDELYHAAVQLTRHDQSGNVTATGFNINALRGAFYSFLLTVGGEIIDENNGVVNIDDTKGTAVLEFFNDFYRHEPPLYTRGIDPIDAFAGNRLAMTFGPLYFERQVKARNTSIDMQFISVPAGPIDGVQSGVIGGYGLVIPRGAKNPNNAWDIMQWWTNDEEALLAYTEIYSALPANITLWESDSIKNHPLFSSVIDEIEHYRVRPVIPGYINFEVQAVFPTIDKLELEMDSMTVAKALEEIKRIGDRTLALERE